MYSAIEKLQKFFKLESERGYDNRAVVGGLDKILPSWKKEAKSQNLNEDLIQTVTDRLNEYANLELDARQSCIQGLLEKLESLDTPAASSTPVVQKETIRASYKPEKLHKAPQTVTRTESKKSSSTSSASVALNAPLTVLSGIGARYAQTFEKLGLSTLADLLYYFPRRYDDYSNLKPINRLAYGEDVTVIASVKSTNSRKIRGGKMQLTETVVADGTGFLRLNWFNQPWIEKQLKPGNQIVISGKVDMYLGRLIITNPDWEPLEQTHLNTNRIVPVYPLTAKVTQRWIRRIMFQAVPFWSQRIPEYLPQSVRDSVDLIPLQTALQQVHFPDSQEMLDASRKRLAFDEIFLLQLGVIKQKFNWQSVDAEKFETPASWLDEQIAKLPFALTGAQQKVLKEIQSDLNSGKPMNRLIQGDVGSGKTVIAALTVAMITRHDAQAAFMAPTSILAEQHYRSLQKMMASGEDSLFKPEEIELLVGNTSASEKERIRTGLLDGSIKLIIGTHALIEDPVEFKHLQLAIIDEQHRFGVEQRSKLRAKGSNPHLLVMTATPIPRSMALTIYGDLDVSVIDEMPVGRQPVETAVLHPMERERAYTLIKGQIEKGHQAFIIYPLVEQGEREERKAAVEEHALLQKDIFPDYQLGLLHGRMKPDEKDEVMMKFSSGEYQILVSTSVVEVGVDIPNATAMLIEGADRFGLAQLHQFRGRVGRGNDQSYCLLIPEKEDALENQRLAVMAESNDGFYLAEKDLEQRGPGQFLGTRQSGYSELKMANLSDVRLIELARNQAKTLFEEDPEFTSPEHSELVKMMERFWEIGKGDIS